VLIGTLADEVSSAGVFRVWEFSSKSGHHFCGSAKRPDKNLEFEKAYVRRTV
jgi:hypothetical protein